VPAKRTSRKTAKGKTATKLDALKEDFPSLTVHQRRLLAAYSRSASVTTAAETAGTCRQTHYLWLRLPEYAAAFAAAKEAAVERLEGECYRRAMAGSDNLLMFALKRHVPAYRDRQTIDMTTDATITHQNTENLTDAERADRVQKLLDRANARRPRLAHTIGEAGIGPLAPTESR
jgi:hypothetical protein